VDELHYRNDLLEVLNEKYIKSEKMYQTICDTMDCAILYYDYLNYQNQVFGKWSTYFEFPISNQKDLLQILNVVHDDSVSKLKEILFLEKTDKDYDSIICKDVLNEKYLDFEVFLMRNERGELESKIIKVNDVTEHQRQGNDLEYLAYYDSLTDLCNRNYFIKLLQGWIKKAEKDNSIISVMIFDINNFRKINDHGGLTLGDEIIQSFGKILNEFSCKNVIVSRFHADIFYVAIKDPIGDCNAEYIYLTVFEKLKYPFHLSNGSDIPIAACVGIVEYPEEANTALELLKYAEIALFKAQEHEKNSFMYFNKTILNSFLCSADADQMLKEAVIHDEFFLFFQPQYDVESNKLRGVEALLRWKNKEGQLISPTVFIPLAEKNGMIVPLGKWVIEESIRIYSEWMNNYKYKMILSINISAIQFYRGELVLDIMNAIKKYKMDPYLLEIEITESVLIKDFSGITEKMNVLRNIGIKVSMDDFGTGYSSLSYLSGLPIDTLKIDKSFIDSVSESDSSRIIIESILKMVKKLGVETVAEGVETKEQYDLLKEMECDCIQGYLLGKPMEASKIEQLIMNEI
jgi:diguanylate cyclase (GGDEF)-like protein